jgi:hypothetical protein
MEKMVFHSSITQQEMGQRRKRNLGWVCALNRSPVMEPVFKA